MGASTSQSSFHITVSDCLLSLGFPAKSKRFCSSGCAKDEASAPEGQHVLKNTGRNAACQHVIHDCHMQFWIPSKSHNHVKSMQRWPAHSHTTSWLLNCYLVDLFSMCIPSLSPLNHNNSSTSAKPKINGVFWFWFFWVVGTFVDPLPRDFTRTWKIRWQNTGRETQETHIWQLLLCRPLVGPLDGRFESIKPQDFLWKIEDTQVFFKEIWKPTGNLVYLHVLTIYSCSTYMNLIIWWCCFIWSLRHLSPHSESIGA